MKPWDILITLAIAEAIIAAVILAITLRLTRTPLSNRLTILSTVFLLQSILSATYYYKWEATGYGADISLPLLGLQTLILAGLVVLYDTIRQ